MTSRERRLRAVTRRFFFRQAGFGIGGLALASLLDAHGPREAAAGAPPPVGAHHRPRARSIIYLFMAGGPSQLDLFDDKPTLRQLDGTRIPEGVTGGDRFAFIAGAPTLLGSPYRFARHGKSGARLSGLLPHLGGVADHLAIVRSVHTDHFNHAPAQLFVNTGYPLVGRPSMGSWLTYGLGSANADLPGFVVMLSGKPDPGAGAACWSSGFLPTAHQGVEFRPKGDPVLYVSNPDGMDGGVRRRSLDALQALNQRHLDEVGDPEIAARIGAYEMAYRMQASVPELTNIWDEPRPVHELYGTEPGQVSFANNCLLARRLVERGVRFVQLYHRGWDHHGTASDGDILEALPQRCRETDRATAALLRDLSERGLLDSTLVIWGGEFGRTPMQERRDASSRAGRDHHPRAFTMWLAGGGVQAGLSLGATDDLGYHVVEDPVHVHDLHATVLHLMGIQHQRLTFRFQGRDHRLTDVHGRVVHKLLA